MTTSAPSSTLQHILLVEDEPGDARLIDEVLHDHPRVRLHTVLDVVHAIHFMTKQQAYFDAPTPDLIILDLQLPIFSGKALLEERRRRNFCPAVPVVVMTTSAAERVECKLLGATEYHVKPREWSQWQALIRQLVARHLGVDLQV
ncbi:MAG: response regulator [Planctomycetes bacterium]|jgi:two-component system response regulator|nr:response regulator [Planctomycetota bacterium]